MTTDTLDREFDEVLDSGDDELFDLLVIMRANRSAATFHRRYRDLERAEACLRVARSAQAIYRLRRLALGMPLEEVI
jgi:hypothetical protein